MISKNFIKGGLIGLLCIYFSFKGFSQSFFYAETITSSSQYGEVRTTQLSEEAISQLKRIKLSKEEWSSLFNLKTKSTNPPVLGTYSIQNDQIVFTPRFLPDPSVTYFVNFSYEALNQLLGKITGQGTFTETVQFASPEASNPRVIRISPEISEIPMNVLRIYIHFSAPMSFQNPYDFIAIENDAGELLTEPFVIVPEGLWNIDRTRLTLLFHPGRIKRGVGPNMTHGNILEIGKSYSLKIHNSWKGSNGKELEKTFEKTFIVSNSLNEVIQYDQWKLNATKGEMDQLLVKTLHPLDQPLSTRMLFIRTSAGQLIPSRVEFKNATELIIYWSNRPETDFELLIDPRLEDVCGNTPLNTFDYESGGRVVSNELLIRQFSIE